NIPRSLPAAELAKLAETAGLEGEVIANVAQAYQHALDTSSAADTIFIGGSTFVVADLLEHLANSNQ
ncbi:MAG: bifunctional folylpolyglutamate synthase/dihydrofolate synthase, partial [Muribaculaceae bacterium]|nr:bifunctional folylpolyglutamate synthase/dihydrofolate synthase [Muribaculaceae bacterium]